MPVNTLITGGTVVIATGTFDVDVAVDGEGIIAVGDASSMPDATGTINAGGLLVVPGTADPHVHTDDMFSTGAHETASAATALGNVTSYVNLTQQAWTDELSIFEEDGALLEGIERKREKAANARVDCAFHGAITREDPAVLSELVDAVDAGVSSFKMFTTYEHDLSNGLMHITMEEIADIDTVGVYHTEDTLLIDTLAARSKTEGRGDPTDYLQSRPDYAEVMATEDVVRTAQETGAKHYGIRTSCRKSMGVLSQSRDDNSVVRVETYTHYTTLTDDVFETQGNLPVIAPPIRKQDDVEAIFEHLTDGTLDVVPTDHCGYKREPREIDNRWDSTLGTNALQVSVPVLHDEAVNEHDFSYPFLVHVISRNPACIFGISDKDTLNPGTGADVILFDPEETHTIATEDSASNADFFIYEGREVTGRVKKTFIRDELIADGDEVVSEPGHGKYINQELPDWDA